MIVKIKRWVRIGVIGLCLLSAGIAVALAIEYTTSSRSAAAVALLRDPSGDFVRQHGAVSTVVLVGSSAKTLSVSNVGHGCARNSYVVLTQEGWTWVDVYFRKESIQGHWKSYELTTGFRSLPQRSCGLS